MIIRYINYLKNEIFIFNKILGGEFMDYLLKNEEQNEVPGTYALCNCTSCKGQCTTGCNGCDGCSGCKGCRGSRLFSF